MDMDLFSLRVVAALVLWACGLNQAQAHHGFAFEFDPEKQGSLIGEISEVRFTNPYVVYLVNAELSDGTTEEWLLRTHNVGVMRRLGWDASTIKVGDRIELESASNTSMTSGVPMRMMGLFFYWGSD